MIDIRPIKISDVDYCKSIVRDNWGWKESSRFVREISQVWSDAEYSPIYYVAILDDSLVGFAGMMQSFIMYGVWDFIWLNVHKDFKGEGIGKRLTEYRLAEIKRCEGRAVHLMTHAPTYYQKFGFSMAKDYGKWKLMTLQLGLVEFET